MKIEGVILAAGLSTRAGTHKMILDVNGKTVLERCVESMYQSCSRIVIVGGYMIENIKGITEKYSKVELIYNKNFESGMFSSVKAGIKRIKADRFFLTPGDYPKIDSKVYSKMLMTKGDIVIPTYEGKKGHPILIDGSFAQDIIWNAEYNSLRDFVNRVGFKAVEVEDSGMLLDIDTMEDYNKMLKLID